MSEVFKVQVEVPENEYSGGKIILSFIIPRIYFGYYVNERLYTLPKEELRRHKSREAIRGFMNMIEKELTKAFEEANENETKKEN